MNPIYEYKGYRYVPSEECEPDNRKIYHDVVTPLGDTVHLDYSPYCTPSEDCFKKWIDLGCPKKDLFSPNWSDTDILEQWQLNAKRFINEKNSEND